MKRNREAHEARVAEAEEWFGLMVAVVFAVMDPAADWREMATVAISGARVRLGRDPLDSCRKV